MDSSVKCEVHILYCMLAQTCTPYTLSAGQPVVATKSYEYCCIRFHEEAHQYTTEPVNAVNK